MELGHDTPFLKKKREYLSTVVTNARGANKKSSGVSRWDNEEMIIPRQEPRTMYFMQFRIARKKNWPQRTRVACSCREAGERESLASSFWMVAPESQPKPLLLPA
jgi:hypothetical protein